jgi:integrase/recombinase XerD
MKDSNGSFVSVLAPYLARYLDLKEALGRRYSIERAVLRHLDSFLGATGTDLSAESFSHWSQGLEHLTSGVRRNHMRIVRNFCLYRRRTVLLCFVPELALFPSLHQSIRPYIFTEAEIALLLRAADGLGAVTGSPLRRETFRLAIVLLYTTGLRRGELLRLVVGDYDAQGRTLLVRQSKFHKSRLLPLSEDASRELDGYLRARRVQHLAVSKDAPLLWSPWSNGKAYTAGGFAQRIRSLLKTAGIRTTAGGPPRVHDLRHTFAVHALLRWYRTGVDVQAKLPFLSTYMGHVNVVSTEHYLHFVDELAGLASKRFERHCGGLITSAAGGAS